MPGKKKYNKLSVCKFCGKTMREDNLIRHVGTKHGTERNDRQYQEDLMQRRSSVPLEANAIQSTTSWHPPQLHVSNGSVSWNQYGSGKLLETSTMLLYQTGIHPRKNAINSIMMNVMCLNQRRSSSIRFR